MRFRIITLFLLMMVLLSAIDAELTETSMIKAILWHNTSAEYRALCYQAFNLAKLRLNEALQEKTEKPRAVVVDLDETVFDNTEFEAGMVLEGLQYPEDHDKWVNSAKAKAVPGALNFLKYAHAKDCAIFYLSNRRTRHLEGSLKNLQKLGFPQAKEENILLKKDTSNKGIRRNKIAQDHNIVLLIGDNLIDFSDVFRMKTVEERFDAVEQKRNDFGKKFILLPNSMYGEWVKSLYGGTRNIPQAEKEKLLIEFLKYDD